MAVATNRSRRPRCPLRASTPPVSADSQRSRCHRASRLLGTMGKSDRQRRCPRCVYALPGLSGVGLGSVVRVWMAAGAGSVRWDRRTLVVGTAMTNRRKPRIAAVLLPSRFPTCRAGDVVQSRDRRCASREAGIARRTLGAVGLALSLDLGVGTAVSAELREAFRTHGLRSSRRDDAGVRGHRQGRRCGSAGLERRAALRRARAACWPAPDVA